MATAKKGGKPSDARNVQYLSVDLTKEMRASLIQWVNGNPDLWDLLEKSLDSGLKFGCSFDYYNECFQAQLTQLPKDVKNPVTLVLIGRGGTLVQAFQALLFKYWVVLEQNMEDGDVKNARGVTDWS